MSMSLLPFTRPAVLLGLLGAGALSTTTALAYPMPWHAEPDQHLGWVQAQRTWADQSHRQHMRRLAQLEQCLHRARQRQDRDQCLRRDEQVRERHWQRDQQDWQSLIRWQGSSTQARLPWR